MVIFLLNSNISAQSNFNSDMIERDIYTRSDVLKRAGLSFLPTVGLITGLGSLDSSEIANLEIPDWMLGIMATQHLPIYLTDKNKAMKYSAFELGSLGMFKAAQEQTTYAFIPLHFFYIRDGIPPMIITRL